MHAGSLAVNGTEGSAFEENVEERELSTEAQESYLRVIINF